MCNLVLHKSVASHFSKGEGMSHFSKGEGLLLHTSLRGKVCHVLNCDVNAKRLWTV